MDHIKRSFLIYIVLSLMFIIFSSEARAEKKIGVLMFTNEGRYIEAKNGIMDQLNEDGFGLPAVKYTIENAEGSKAKAEELAQEFAKAKMDLVITLGTSATVPVANAIKDVPIVFGFVFDPIYAGIAKDWKSSGNNTTGVSGQVTMSKVIDTLKEFKPIKRLIVIYTPGEKNSKAQLIELQNLLSESQIKVIPIILNKKEEVAQSLSAAIHTADAIFVAGSSITGESIPQIVDIANRKQVITISFLNDLIEKGVLLGVCANPYHVGRLTGQKAVKVLKGANPSSIPIETDKNLDLIINMKTAKAGQFNIPPEFMKKVTKKIE